MRVSKNSPCADYRRDLHWYNIIAIAGAAARAFKLGEFRLCLGLGVTQTNNCELLVRPGPGDFAVDAGFGECPLNRLAHFFERAHVLIGGKLFQGSLNTDVASAFLRRASIRTFSTFNFSISPFEGEPGSSSLCRERY